MEQKTNKIQVYLDEQTHQKIQVLAKNDSISVSKYVARVLENHTELGQACRDARDRLLASLSIIDSQYATT